MSGAQARTGAGLRLARWAGSLSAAILSACAAGPDYERPAVDMPAAWTTEQPWHAAKPDDAATRGQWWRIFADPRLDRLEADALAQNQTLTAAIERLAQARAQAKATAAALFPQVDATLGAAREKISKDRPLSDYGFPNFSTVQNDFTAGLSVRYEADLFGGIRRRVEASRAQAQQAQADTENTRLLLAAEVATDYFSLVELDDEIDVVNQNIIAQRHALDFVSSRHDLGVASGLDLAQQQSELDTTITQVDLLRVQRAQFEHALATLTGVPAPRFAVAQRILRLEVPRIPIGVPSDLLQRRPDVASAERAMAAANAQIGVAKAAFFPSIPIAGGLGVESRQVADLFNAASTLWSFGVSATQTLFDAGRLSANMDFAKAGYRAAVADYRGTVLTAVQEVQDGLTGYSNLARAAGEARSAVASAQRVADLANDRYAGGLANYLDVITAQQALLANQRQEVQINGQQMLVAVFLVKALGGIWPNAPGAGAQAPRSGAVASKR